MERFFCVCKWFECEYCWWLLLGDSVMLGGVLLKGGRAGKGTGLCVTVALFRCVVFVIRVVTSVERTSATRRHWLSAYEVTAACNVYGADTVYVLYSEARRIQKCLGHLFI